MGPDPDGGTGLQGAGTTKRDFKVTLSGNEGGFFWSVVVLVGCEANEGSCECGSTEVLEVLLLFRETVLGCGTGMFVSRCLRIYMR